MLRLFIFLNFLSQFKFRFNFSTHASESQNQKILRVRYRSQHQTAIDEELYRLHIYHVHVMVHRAQHTMQLDSLARKQSDIRCFPITGLVSGEYTSINFQNLVETIKI